MEAYLIRTALTTPVKALLLLRRDGLLDQLANLPGGAVGSRPPPEIFGFRTIQRLK